MRFIDKDGSPALWLWIVCLLLATVMVSVQMPTMLGTVGVGMLSGALMFVVIIVKGVFNR